MEDDIVKEDEAKLMFERAGELRATGRFREAIRVYSDLLESFEVSSVYNQRGLTNVDLGNVHEGISDFTNAIRLTKDPDYYANRGKAYLRIGNIDKALSDFEDALLLKPNHVIALNGRGSSFRRSSNEILAETDFRSAIDVAPDYMPSYHNLALFMLSKSRWADLLQLLDVAISKCEPTATLLSIRGDANRMLGLCDDARRDYQSALRIDPCCKRATCGLTHIR